MDIRTLGLSPCKPLKKVPSFGSLWFVREYTWIERLRTSSGERYDPKTERYEHPGVSILKLNKNDLGIHLFAKMLFGSSSPQKDPSCRVKTAANTEDLKNKRLHHQTYFTAYFNAVAFWQEDWDEKRIRKMGNYPLLDADDQDLLKNDVLAKMFGVDNYE